MRSLLVTLSAAIGIAVGVRAAVSITVAGPSVFLQPDLIPVEALGITWSELAVWPAEVQRLGVGRLMGAVAAMAAAVIAVATLNAATILAEGSAARGHELAVRHAIGAAPSHLLGMLLRELRVLLLGSLSLGIPAGLVVGLALRSSWPGVVSAVASTPPIDVVVVLLSILAVAGAAHVGTALRATRSARAVRDLRSGSRAGWDPSIVFFRRTLSALHVTVAGTVVLGAWALSRSSAAAVSHGAVDDLAVVTGSATRPDQWATLLQELETLPGLAAESLSAPGALVGLGVRDLTITECGACSLGGLPAPLWNASAEVHSVGPGFHELMGISVLDGRGVSTADVGTAPLVAVVSRRLANTAFEGGRAVGKRLRLGNDVATWYTVVGIVDEHSVPVLGKDGGRRGAVYVSALQRPPQEARLLLRGDDPAVASAVEIMRSLGLRPEDPVGLEAYLKEAAAPVRWAGLLVRLLGLAALLLAGHGVYVAALHTTRRRARDIAVRSALGASTAAIVRVVLSERARTTGWGLAGLVFFGTLSAAGLEKAGGVGAAGPLHYAVVSAFAMTLVLTASIRAVREALAVEPGDLLD
jgi:hypothetical protein